jgi:hypothetical protein
VILVAGCPDCRNRFDNGDILHRCSGDWVRRAVRMAGQRRRTIFDTLTSKANRRAIRVVRLPHIGPQLSAARLHKTRRVGQGELLAKVWVPGATAPLSIEGRRVRVSVGGRSGRLGGQRAEDWIHLNSWQGREL